MSSAGTLEVTLKLDSAQFGRAMQAANGDIENISKKADGMTTAFKQAPAAMARLGGVLAVQSGAMAEFGGQAGMVASKISGLAALALTGGAFGIGMAALTAALSLASLGIEKLRTSAGIGEDALKLMGDAAAEAGKKAASTKSDIEALQDQMVGLGRTSIDANLINTKLALAHMTVMLQDSEQQWDKMLGVMREASILTRGFAIDAVEAAQKEHKANLELQDQLEDKVRVLEEAKKAQQAQEAAERRAAEAAKKHAQAERELADAFQKAYDEFEKLAQATRESSEEVFREDFNFAHNPAKNLAAPVTDYRPAPRMSAGPGPGVNLERERLTADLNDLSSTIDTGAKSIGNAMAFAAQTLLSKIGEMGRTIQAGIQGFQAGGPWGAVIAVLIELFSHAKAFKDIVAMLDRTLFGLVAELAPLVEGMKPGFEFFASMVSGVGQVLGLLAELLGGIAGSFNDTGVALQAFNDGTQILFTVIKYVAIGIANIVWAIAQVFNAIIRTIATIVGWFSEDAAEAVRSWQINIDAIDETIRNLHDSEYSRKKQEAYEMGEASSAVNNFTDSMRDATEELTNVPVGFKVAAARFESIAPELGGGAGSSAVDANGTTIGQLIIYAWDQEEAFRQFDRMSREKKWRNGGSSQANGGSFSTPNNGAG